MTKEKWLNLLERAFWTFVEVFLGTLMFTGLDWKAPVISAISAGLSAVKTLILEFAGSRLIDLNKKKIENDGIGINDGTDVE